MAGKKKTPIKKAAIKKTKVIESATKSLCKEYLHESEELYRQLIELSKDGIVLIDHKGLFRMANPAACSILGYSSEEELVGLPVTKTYLPEDYSLYAQRLKEIKLGESPRFERRAIRKDGKIIDVEVSTTPIDHKRYQAIIRDVSERKRLEEALSKNSSLLRTVIDNEPECVKVLDREGRLIEMNPAGLAMIDATLDQVKGQKVIGLVAEEYRVAFNKMIKDVFNGKTVRLVFDMIGLKGRKLTLETTSAPIKDKAGNVVSLIGVTRDITQKKLSEELVKKERNQAQRFLDIAEVMIAVLNPKGEVTLINKKGGEILGYKNASELIGRNWFDTCLPKKNITEVKAVFKKIMSGEIKSVEFYENPVQTKNGSERIIAFHNTVMRDSSSKITGILFSGEDVTEQRKQADALLKASKNIYKALFNSSRDAIMTLEPPLWNFTSGNPTTIKMFKTKSEKDFLSYAPWMLSPELQPDGQESKKKARIMIEQAMDKGENFFEWVHKRTNGEEFPAEVLLSRVEQEEKTFLQAVVRDITERKKLEKRVEELAEEKFKIVFDNANDGMVLADAKTKVFTVYNDSFCRMLGYTKEEVKTLTVADIHPKKDLPYVLKQFEKQLKKEIVVAENLPVKRKDGSIFYADISTSPVTIHGKKFALGMFRDITERKKLEENYRKIFDESPLGIVTVGLDSSFIKVNKSFCDFIGYSEEELLSLGIKDITHPNHIAADLGNIKKLINGEITNYKTEKQYIRKNGDSVWGLTTANLVKEDEKNLYLLGTIENIDSRKKAEKQLEKKIEEISSFFDVVPDLLCISDNKGEFVRVNMAWEKLLGYSVKELIGKKILDFVHKDDKERTQTMLNISPQEPVIDFTNRYLGKDGSYRTLEWRSRPIGGIVYSTARDITGRPEKVCAPPKE